MIVVDDILTEVEDDLAHGDHASARRRLREALVTRPHRLDLRRRLAGVYRMLGDLPQAGRWGFLEEDAPEDEVTAFRTACGNDASLMLEALAWGEDDEGEEEDDAQVTAVAWERIAEVRRAYAAQRKSEGHHHKRERPGHPPAVPYPFTPPGGITRPTVEATPTKKPRPRELVGLGLIFVGITVMLIFLLAIAAGIFWAIRGVVENTYF